MFKKILSILLILLFILLVYNIKAKKTSILYENNKIKDSGIWIINIPKIKLKESLILDDIRSNNITGVVIFKNYGRPSEINSNTIVGAHSGIGQNAYFNDIDKLSNGDEIYIYYNSSTYKYKVYSIYDVFETDVSPLKRTEGKTTLTLITCKKNNSKKRVIVVAELL